MKTPLVRVVLHGKLAEVAGRKVWLLAARSVGEIIRAIEANTRRVYKFLREEREGLVPYRVLINGADHTCLEDLHFPRQMQTVDLVPDPVGGAGEWQTIIGALLIVAAVVLLATGAAPATGYLGVYGATLIGVLAGSGVSLFVGGISQLIFGSPKMDLSKQDRPNNKASNDFSGPINAVAQGNPVPVGYGMLLVGSQVISAGLQAADAPLT